MSTILAAAAPAGAAGTAGTIALVLILLAMIVGLVLIVRTIMVKLHNRVASPARRGVKSETPETGDRGELPPAKSGRELKARYLRGDISKAEFDEQLRALQLSEYLEDRE